MKKQTKKADERVKSKKGTTTHNGLTRKKELENKKSKADVARRTPVKGVEDPLKKNEEQYFPEEEIENQPGRKKNMPEEVPTPRPHMPK